MDKIEVKTLTTQHEKINAAALTPLSLPNDRLKWHTFIQQKLDNSQQPFLVAVIATIDEYYLVLPKGQTIPVSINEAALGIPLSSKQSENDVIKPIWLMAKTQKEELLPELNLSSVSTTPINLKALKAVSIESDISPNIYWVE